MINQKRLLAEFMELVKIKASSRAEREVVDVVKAKLTNLNMDVIEDGVGEKIGGDCGNVIAYLKGTVPDAPVLMLSAHLDCVEPCGGIEPQIKDGIIISAGNTILGADDKAGAAGILEALRTVKENNIPFGDIQVVFTVAEESGINGSKNLDPALLKADFGYALDGGGHPGEVIIMAPGQNSINVIVHGKTAHAGVAPEEGINAVVVAGKAMAVLNQGRIDEETTANVGIIRGGHATNIVPDKVEIMCEARSRNVEKLERQTRHMHEIFVQVAAANGAKADVIVKKAYDPYVLANDASVIALAVQAAESIGLPSKLTATGGGSDANFFNSYGVPCAVLGIGMSKVHTTDEFIKETDLYDTAKWVVALIKHTALMHK